WLQRVALRPAGAWHGLLQHRVDRRGSGPDRRPGLSSIDPIRAGGGARGHRGGHAPQERGVFRGIARPPADLLMTASNTQKKRILVTGGSGAVGTYLVKELRDRGHDVFVAEIRHSHHPQHARCDVGEFRQLERLWTGGGWGG